MSYAPALGDSRVFGKVMFEMFYRLRMSYIDLSAL